MVNGTEPARLPGCTDPPAPPGNEAADADNAAAILERLAAVEANIREDAFRQPAEVVEAIARLWAAGGTIAEISDKTGVSKEIVRDRLRRAGLIGYRWRENHRHVQEVLERRGAELAAAYEAGGSITGLAADAGISVTALRSYLTSMGLAIRNPYRRTQEILEARGEELVAAYEAGASFTGLAAETGLNHITIRTFLIGRGVTLRHDHGGHKRRSGRRTGQKHGR